ncbi:MAG: DUF2520 domain-containing protein, partial [Myxococcota bacterium]
GVPKALTGPVVRGDVDTVSRHRQAIRRTDRGALAAYEALLPVIIDTALAAGLPRNKASALRKLTRTKR